MVRWTLARGLLAALLVLSIVPLSLGLSASFGDFSAHAQGVIQNIRVEGNKRVEPETVRSYLTFSTGDAYDPAQIDESLKQLFATGLFQDVRIRREGGDHRHRRRREPDREPGGLRGEPGGRGRHAGRRGAAQAARGLYPRPRAGRRAAHPQRLSPPRPLRRPGRSQDHQARQQPHRRRVRDHRGPGHQGARHQLHRQRRPSAIRNCAT